ncbi:MAG TPA: hypothetical protein VGM13_03630 [Thermoanaerobaculia bacterium]|jgi:hypothetical protein
MGAAGMPNFELSKWYLDAVGEDGEVFIGYRAALRWRRLAVSYASALTGGARETRTATSVRSEGEPVLRMGSLAWEAPALELQGTWTGNAPALLRTLYECPGGSVVWACLFPRAEAGVRIGGRDFRGLGYAERLEMTLPPWRLPLETLRWGRFLSPDRFVVWIDWQAPERSRTWVFVDGIEAREAGVSDEEISFEGGRIRLPSASRLSLRAGRVSDLLRDLPLSLLLRLFRRARAMHETKWRTRGVLECAGAPAVEGWAIHEVVRFRP